MGTPRFAIGSSSRSSGRDVRREVPDVTSGASMAQVLGLAVTFGDNPGELDLVWDPTPKARSYEIQCRYTAQAGSPWVYAKVSFPSSITLTGLNSAQVIQLRVRAIGPNDLEGPWSDLAEHLVP